MAQQRRPQRTQISSGGDLMNTTPASTTGQRKAQSEWDKMLAQARTAMTLDTNTAIGLALGKLIRGAWDHHQEAARRRRNEERWNKANGGGSGTEQGEAPTTELFGSPTDTQGVTDGQYQVGVDDIASTIASKYAADPAWQNYGGSLPGVLGGDFRAAATEGAQGHLIGGDGENVGMDSDAYSAIMERRYPQGGGWAGRTLPLGAFSEAWGRSQLNPNGNAAQDDYANRLAVFASILGGRGAM